jgi:hypothetical protein
MRKEAGPPKISKARKMANTVLTPDLDLGFWSAFSVYSGMMMVFM